MTRKNKQICSAKISKNKLKGYDKLYKCIENSNYKGAWDDKSTFKQNCKRIGILINSNHIDSKKPFINPVIEAVKSAEPHKVSNKKKSKIKNIPFQERCILNSLIRKYGEKYRSMQCDPKLNVYQYTEAQLKKRIELLKKLQETKAKGAV